MKKIMLSILALSLVLSVFLFGGSVSTVIADESKVLQFNTMIGVPRPFTGATNAIRGVPGGGLPWVIEFGKGKLSPDGSVDVLVKGLVFDPNDQAVIDRGLAGINTVPNFKVIVSCLSKDADGNPITVNVSTGLFPADSEGNARINDNVALPSPCIAPILFVTNPNGSWFASTGLIFEIASNNIKFVQRSRADAFARLLLFSHVTRYNYFITCRERCGI